jgi:hypothetical protein
MTATLTAEWSDRRRLGGLRRFAAAITILNVFGHTLLGFEQSWAQPVTALAVAYSLELLLEWLDARAARRPPRFRGGPRTMMDFLLSAHITGMAVSMLLYANDRLGPVAFAAAVGIASKHLLRVTCEGRSRHFLNPSNFGIAATLLAFPWVGIAPPYMFTESLSGAADWIVPAVIVSLGTLLNARYTRKLPLIAAWLVGFATQALFRSLLHGTPLAAALAPMTGPAFVLYTFYMVTDPATTPVSVRGQVTFGAMVAATYGALVNGHVVFGLFFSLAIVCLARGAVMFASERLASVMPARREASLRGVGVLRGGDT